MMQVIGHEQVAAGEANRTERGGKESDANDPMYFWPCGKRFFIDLRLRSCSNVSGLWSGPSWISAGSRSP
jgi:hypothetical protein